MEIGINIIASTNSGRFRIGQEGQYSYLPKGAKIIWLSEPISLVADDNIIYEIKYTSGKYMEGIISQVGEDELGFYIILKVLDYTLRNDVSIMHNNLSLGEAVLKQVFNYNDIPVVTELSRSIGEQWKLMLSYITDIETEENNISFSIRDRFFNDIVTKLELLNVSNQGYKNIYNDSDNFKSNKLRQIFMRQESKEGYIIYLKNKTGNSFVTEWKEDNSDAGEYSIEENENTIIIKCSEILITSYNSFVRELKERGIQCISRDESNDEKFNAQNLRKQWLDTFAHDVDITSIHTEQNLWHIFSYNKVKGFEKEEANKKFDDMIKKSLYIFFDSTENCYKLKNAENLTLKDIEQYNGMDVYIVNEEFTWTYVLTHEDGWLGPFFYAI